MSLAQLLGKGARSSRAAAAAPQQYMRKYATGTHPMPRHLMSIADLTTEELRYLVERSLSLKSGASKGPRYGAATPSTSSGKGQVSGTEEVLAQWPLTGETIAMLFTKRSTRTRVSTEAAAAYLGANSMFLGRDDIQLGVNESLYDTSRVISSMVSALVARVDKHQDVQDLAAPASVPVINALSDAYHPLQAIADIATISEAFDGKLAGLQLAWIGDANNVLHDLMIACAKLGISVRIATPVGYEVRDEFMEIAQSCLAQGAQIETTTDPRAAATGANIIVTDTWISMGQEDEKAKRLQAFEGFQITEELVSAAKPDPNWIFMHCLPRHPEEVSDEVFYSDRSRVFQEAENRKWTMIAVLEAFVVKQGRI